MSETLPPASPAAFATWSRVARRVRVPLSFAFAVAYVCLARPTRASLLAGTVLLLPGLVLRGLAAGHVQKDRRRFRHLRAEARNLPNDLCTGMRLRR